MERLRPFKVEFGHPNVPSTYRDRPLANFIMNVRKNRRQGILSEDRIRTLNEMGLTWNLKWRASRGAQAEGKMLKVETAGGRA
jgi:hypothetical protein